MLRYVGVIWLRFLIESLYLICIWLDEDQRTNIIKTHIHNIVDCIFNFINHPKLHNEQI